MSCAQVRLHILLQLDGLAEWMPAMAEQVGVKFRMQCVRLLSSVRDHTFPNSAGLHITLTYRIRVENTLSITPLHTRT